MEPLISINDFSDYAEITQNLDEPSKLVPYILQAQKYDLRPILGDSLFFELMDNPLQTTPPYNKLIDGDTYVVNTIDYIYEGLKPALVYRTYARYLQHAGVASTEYGFVNKRNDYSERITDKKESQLINYARSLAEAEEKLIVKYLNARGTTIFPLWNSACCTPYPGVSTGAMRVRSIDPYKNRNCQWE